MSVVGEKLTKSFAGIRVLDNVDLTVKTGEIHALLGANGSGKSTLVKILTGVYQPEGGMIRVGDRPPVRSIATPHEANALGIAVVHQEAPVIDTMSVAECIALFRGYPTTAMGRVRWKQLHDESAEILGRYNIAISPRQLAGELNPAQRALVALVIALDRVQSGLELLILDEVTASLPEDEAGVYLEKVASIAASGIGVLMVTHRLAELNGLANTVTVLRDGLRVYCGPAGELDEEGLVGQMVGEQEQKELASKAPGAIAHGSVQRLWNAGLGTGKPTGSDQSGDAMRVKHLSGENLRDISFRVGRGEIVGVAGLADSGVTELPQILAGVSRRHGGEIRVADKVLAATAGPREAMDAGLALLPADRLRNGGIGTLSVADNIVLPNVDRYWHRRKDEQALLRTTIGELDVRPPLPQAVFGQLSGGNQQKALLGKWLLTRPRLLILDDPTSGVDPGARAKIFEILRDAANEGVGILFFSTEPEQLAAMCSRLIVLRGGKIATELAGDDLTREMISQWCYA